MPDVKNNDLLAQFRARVKGLLPSTPSGASIVEPPQNLQQQDLWQKIKPDEMVGGKQVPKSYAEQLNQFLSGVINYLDVGTAFKTDKRLPAKEAEALDRAVRNAGISLQDGSGSVTWRSLSLGQKQQVAQIFMNDPFKENPFASSIASLKAVEAGTPAMGLLTAPITALATPFAKMSVGEAATKEDWINFAIMAALSAVPGLQGMGTVAKGAAKAIMAGTGAYQTVQTLKNWDYMSNPERAMAIAIDVALLAGGAPSKGFFKKAINQAKPEVKEAFLSESGELKLGGEPIKPPTYNKGQIIEWWDGRAGGKWVRGKVNSVNVETGLVNITSGGKKFNIHEGNMLRIKSEIAIPTEGKIIPEKGTPVTGEVTKQKITIEPIKGMETDSAFVNKTINGVERPLGAITYQDTPALNAFTITRIASSKATTGFGETLSRSDLTGLLDAITSETQGKGIKNLDILALPKHQKIYEAAGFKVIPTPKEYKGLFPPEESFITVRKEISTPKELLTPAEVTPVAEAPQPQIKPVVSEVGMKPPEVPPTKPVEVIGKTSSGAEKLNMVDLQGVTGVLERATSPDFARKIGNLPVFKQINKALNPSAIAETSVEKWRVGRAVLMDEAQQKTQGVMSYLHKLGKSGDVFSAIDENGIFKTGKFKGLTLQELAENPSKFDLGSKQRLWLDQAFEIEKAKLDFLKRNGIEINELSFAEGGRYAGRRVVAKVLPTGELMDVGYIGGGARRPGAKLGVERTRYFKTAEEAKNAGYVYMPYDEALQLNVQAAYNRVADKMVTDWLLTKIPWRTTGAPEELILAAEAAKLKLDKSKQLLAALNRALRGERGVPEQTVSSIASVLPNEANQLKILLADIRAGKETASSVKQFESSIRKLIASNKSEYQRAVNARVRAREFALQTHVGEARVEAPALAGKILTGEEAKVTADILRKELSPQANAVLTNINKINAITRYFALAGDFSPFGIQLLFEAFNSPKIFVNTMKAFLKGMSGDLYHARLLNKYKGLIDKHPNLILTSQGTEWTEAFRTGGLLQKGIFKYPGKLLEPFQKGFEASLDEAQLLKAEALEPLAKTPKDIADLDQFINELHGMTSSAKLGTTVFTRQVESVALLAPRYFRAIGGLLFDVFRGGLRGKLARESMIKLTVGMMLSSVAIDLARGASEEEIIDRINPMSSNFFTWEVAGQKIGPGSKIRSVVKFIGDSTEDPENLLRFSMDNPTLRFIRGNLSMTVGTAIDLVLGRNFIGEPSRDSLPQLTETIFAENLVPLWLQTLWENGSDITDIQGTSVRLGAQLFGGRAYPETLWDKVKKMRESLSQKMFGVAYSELNNAQRDELRRKNTDYANLEKEAQGEQTERGTKEQRIYTSIKEQIIAERNNAMELLAQAYLNGDITKKEYDDRRSYVKPYYSGGMNVLWNVKQQLDPQSVKDMEDWLGENEKPEDKALDAYWQKYNELLDESELPTDWDEINAELENYLNSIKPEHREYILAHKNDSIYDLPPLAQQVEFERLSGIEDETWWDYYQDALYVPETNPQTTPTQELPSEDLETRIRKGFQDILK